MKKVGEIKELWRYPVKGMAGESVQAAEFGKTGIVGDRTWAVRDVARKEIQSCKFRPELLLCGASFAGEVTTSKVEIRFPDGSVFVSDDPNVHVHLSELVSHQSELVPLPKQEDMEFYKRYRENEHDWLSELKATFTREDGEPLPAFLESPEGVAEFVSIPGTFFLVAPLHIVTTSSVEYMKRCLPEADWDMRRFRPNFVVDTAGVEGLVEQDWVGQTLVINGIELDCFDTAVRCGAVTRPLEELPRDPSMLRSIVKDADQNLGIYAQTNSSAGITVGDAVYLK